MSEAPFPLQIIVVLGVLLLGTMMAALGMAVYQANYGPRARLKRRVEQIAGPAAASQRKDGKTGGGARKKNIQNKLKEMEDKRTKKSKATGIGVEIMQAGLTISVRQYFIISACVGLLAAFISFLAGMPLLTTALVTAAASLWFPRFVLRKMVAGRVAKFTANFANALDIIVRGIRTGLPVGECLGMIGREMPEPVGLEFRMITDGQRIGMSLDEVLGRLVERVPTSEAKFFAIVLLIQKQTGGNLADTLDKLSTVLRERKKMRDKITALSSEAKSSAIIIAALPFLVAGLLSLTQPKYISSLFTSDTGHMLLTGCAVCMGIGILIMKKMINFQI
ncbi:MAG: type II secretion system F family protein [Alphaproteobacteria bacterium]|nr:type II secretion system F family protein [Alphaproteobacteria bacterium]